MRTFKFDTDSHSSRQGHWRFCMATLPFSIHWSHIIMTLGNSIPLSLECLCQLWVWLSLSYTPFSLIAQIQIWRFRRLMFIGTWMLLVCRYAVVWVGQYRANTWRWYSAKGVESAALVYAGAELICTRTRYVLPVCYVAVHILSQPNLSTLCMQHGA